MGLGRRLNLKSIACRLYLLAGESDDITTSEQVFAAESLDRGWPSNHGSRLPCDVPHLG